ncbi:ABC-2 type transporter [Fusarium pseudocircinatum]|uniref:ABC-2 type transporter n=1 Tax=Fusarium pseudocircinatum TaxID=56676 RepID=A0A8H5P7Y1_9HYPO|nr:ABC-2 type transporter [Fusarium pseudocircinatum]
MFDSDPNAAPHRTVGVAYTNLSVCGSSSGSQYQKTVGNIIWSTVSDLVGRLTQRAIRQVRILEDFDGIVEPGEMLLVLGPPGSGCSTLLKVLAGRTEGLQVSAESVINYRGMDPADMHTRFRGDIMYNAEVDVHLPALTVGDTLEFAARARVPSVIPGGFTSNQFGRILRDVTMAMFRITHTTNSKVGNDYIRGVSGGERKRVSIAEAALVRAKLQCWDNSTRGLDSDNAISFCETLRVQADVMGIAAVVAIYQAPQSAYDVFDKVTVLYEGRQIFFGHTQDARLYFEKLGFESPERQTTAGFLTSMTSPQERRVRPGWEAKVPRTSAEFAARWQASPERESLVAQLVAYQSQHPRDERWKEFAASHKAERSTAQRVNSPYTIPFPRQLSFNLIMGFVLGSMFYNLADDTSSLYYRGGLIFFAMLFNAFASELEVLTLYAQRPVVEKHNQYALYHQSAEAIASYVMELPYKTTNTIVFNLILYFLAQLRQDAGAFFFFILTSYLILLTMSGVYRTVACVTRTSHQAMVPSAILTLGLMLYSGFTLPVGSIRGWARWINYINPLAYGFEALMVNELHGRQFPCAHIIPSGQGYDSLKASQRTCVVVGAVPGSTVVDGGAYLEGTYQYEHGHKWRNIGILFGFTIFFFFTYVLSAEYARPAPSRGEVLVFRRGKSSPDSWNHPRDAENQYPSQQLIEKPLVASLQHTIATPKPSSPSVCEKPVFHWEDVCYDINIKGETRRILDHVDGWVQPGVTTVLMGASGAGKTTLLDSLAGRISMGVLSGSTLVDGKSTDRSFPHQIGYVQQQDLHLNTMTVREALEFSALLRQSDTIPRDEKLAYVNEVVSILDMAEYVDAIIGVPGEGLNVEQRKRLTIGIELAARPQLLVFFDEPTSGLDSQTSWAICDLIERLARSGQAILCTIHQPSAMLFARFNRLLLLQPGGKTVYFGDIGQNSRTMIEYFERNGAPTCPPEANPAEWMLKTTLPSTEGPQWFDIWRASPEYSAVKEELVRLRSKASISTSLTQVAGVDSHEGEFTVSFSHQFREAVWRITKHFWRSPVYIWSKLSVTILFSLFIGFSFRADNSLQGLQNQLYSFFMCLLIFNPFSKQIMPMFIPQRALYEVRERPSKIYRWTAFILSNVLIELVWNSFTAVIFFFCWYYPAGFVQNTTSDDVHIRGFTVFLFIWQLILWISTFSQLAISAIETADLAGVPASLISVLCMAFCGVGVARADLRSIWRDFMYRVSPMTYLVSGALSTGIHGSDVNCSTQELVRVPGYDGQNCSSFLSSFVERMGGYLVNPSATDECLYCSMSTTDQYLSQFDMSYDDRWRNFGIGWVFIIFNIAATCGLYCKFKVELDAAEGLKVAVEVMNNGTAPSDMLIQTCVGYSVQKNRSPHQEFRDF